MPVPDQRDTRGLDQFSWPTFGVVIPVRRPPCHFRGNIERLHRFLATSDLVPFEIVLVPNSAPGDVNDPARTWCQELASTLPNVRTVPHVGPAGKGAALQTGMLAARGRYLFFTDADLPFGLDFFERAAKLLQSGTALVVGNRRSPESMFEVPVPLLRLTYGRHRLSLMFNRLVRFVLPIRFVDTQAGIKGMIREFAQSTFTRDICPGFFFDLELFLVAHELNLSMADLPVHFTQRDEATTVRLMRQSLIGMYWLLRIKIRHMTGYYGRIVPAEIIDPTEAVLDTQ